MKSTELAQHVHDIVSKAQGRILAEGAEQYEAEDGTQQFEVMPMDELAEYLEEELLDQINYSIMMILRLRELRGIMERMIQNE